jgi:hypothetical protein
MKKIVKNILKYDTVETTDGYIYEKGPWIDEETDNYYDWRFYSKDDVTNIDYAINSQLYHWDVEFIQGN